MHFERVQGYPLSLSWLPFTVVILLKLAQNFTLQDSPNRWPSCYIATIAASRHAEKKRFHNMQQMNEQT